MNVSNTYTNLDLKRTEILRDLMGTEAIRVLEERYDNGRVGRITEWFNKNYGGTPSIFRRKAAAGTTAVVFGSFFFLDATRQQRRNLAVWLEAQQAGSAPRPALPDGDYQIWVVDGYTCVMCTDAYQNSRTIYRKIYKHKLDLDHPVLKGTMSCIHSTETRGVPLPDSTLAYLFNLIWVPEDI